MGLAFRSIFEMARFTRTDRVSRSCLLRGDPAVAEIPLDQREEADAANGSLTMPKVIGLLLMAMPILWFACQMLTFQA